MDLEKKAKELRRKVLNLGLETGINHFGGYFSEIEILISLYDVIMKPEDKFILSKGHACIPLYILLRERGYNPKISTHPDIDVNNGINCTTGSLGHGLPIGTGMAYAKKIKGEKGKIYVLIGDGECQEGTIWESSLIAVAKKLDNLTVIIDKNKLQALDKTEDILPSGNLVKKFESFGYDVAEVDGHNFSELIPALEKKTHNNPKMIIANTIKGKGISYMENNPIWHCRTPTKEELGKAYEELK